MSEGGLKTIEVGDLNLEEKIVLYGVAGMLGDEHDPLVVEAFDLVREDDGTATAYGDLTFDDGANVLVTWNLTENLSRRPMHSGEVLWPETER